jgi:hypothetical protein
MGASCDWMKDSADLHGTLFWTGTRLPQSPITRRAIRNPLVLNGSLSLSLSLVASFNAKWHVIFDSSA